MEALMTRLLLSGVLTGSVIRRTRRADGRTFGVATVRDADRGEPRIWTVYVNDVELIERFERFKDGEPIAVGGPFYVAIDGARLVHRITADSIIGARKERKKRAKADLLAAVDPDDAPKDDDKGRPFDDAIPF